MRPIPGLPIWARLVLLLVLLLSAGGCTTVRPDPSLLDPATPEQAGVFSHDLFDRVLARFVDGKGRVDYAGLARDPADLHAYFAALSRSSPDSDPSLFPDEASRLAYWLNAYNASALMLVVDHYPITSVREVPRPPGLFFMPRLVGFFFYHRVTLGGDKTNLYILEHSIIRKRFRDPRIHFAINCASASCPHLPQRAFRGEDLEAMLQAETEEFVADPRSVRIDLEDQRVWLSSIFDWYESDFVDWPTRRHPSRGNTLLDYVERHLDAAGVTALRACVDCRVEFIEFDWALNSRLTAN